MALLILVNGKPLDPRTMAKSFLPGDLFYVCPECGSEHVRARPPRTIEDLGREHHTGASQFTEWIPRKQDRWCLDCDTRWTAILAPEILARD